MLLGRRLAFALCVVTSALLLLAVLAMAGHPVDGSLGPIRLRVRDFARPLAAAGVLQVLATALAWRSGAYRRATLVLGVGVAVALLGGFARQAPEYAASGDLAVIESYTIHALNGQALLGPYSRFQWNHPGPMYFLLLAPFYVLSEYRAVALAVGAMAINMGALAIMVWTAARLGRPTFALIATGLSVVYVARVGDSLTSAWNPHVLGLPLMALVVTCAALVTAGPHWLPAVAVVATYLVQTHVGLAPVVLSLCAVSFGAAAWVARRSTLPDERVRLDRAVRRTAWLLLLLWLLPLAEQLSGSPGNLTRLVRFFRTDPLPNQAFADAFSAWADLTTAFLRQDFKVAYGGAVFQPSAVWWSRPAAMLQVALVAWAALSAARNGHRFHVALGLLLLIASAASVWSISRVKGPLYDHVVFWVTGLGVLNTAAAVDALLFARRQPSTSTGRRAVGVGCAALLLLAAFPAGEQLARQRRYAARPSGDDVTVQRLWAALQDYRASRDIGKPLIRIEHPKWGVAAGVIVQLQKAGVSFAVEPTWLPMFSSAVRPTGDETTVLAFAREPLAQELLTDSGYDKVGVSDGVVLLSGPTCAGRR